MPHNLIKVYNELLDLVAYTETQRTESLKRIFNRDIAENPNFAFRTKKINPTTADGEDTMERFFLHLTTMITDKSINKREFDMQRSRRLHWIKYHIEESKKDNMKVFSVQEPQGIRTYIYDVDEQYVIILEPLRNKDEYYMLTAYYMEGKDTARNKMDKKYKRRMSTLM